MRAFSTLALAGSFALSLVSGAFAAPTAGAGSLVNAPVNANVENVEADVLNILSSRSVEKRCDACDAHGSDLVNVLLDLQVSVGVEVDVLTGLDVSDYKTEVIAPILLNIVAKIGVAVDALVKIVADVKVGAGLGLGAVVGVVVQVAVVAQILVKLIISIVGICAHIIVAVGGDIAVCGDALVQVGVQLQALISVCLQLVVGLKVVLAVLIGPIAAILQICGFVGIGALVGIKL